MRIPAESGRVRSSRAWGHQKFEYFFVTAASRLLKSSFLGVGRMRKALGGETKSQFGDGIDPTRFRRMNRRFRALAQRKQSGGLSDVAGKLHIKENRGAKW